LDGYRDVGYVYVNIDDCWSAGKRDANDRLQSDPDRFPRGIKFLADYMHARGLKLGIYGDIGTATCGGYPGTKDYFTIDMETFADWGIDSVKVDGCNADIRIMNVTYPQLSRVINATGHPMVFSCSWPAYTQDLKYPIQYKLMKKYCNLWRNYYDIDNNWESVAGIIEFWGSANIHDYNNFVNVAGPGAWNDPDQLIVGDSGLTVVQQQTHMALWALVASPLYMSNDLRAISNESKTILLNKEIIDVNQDPLGKQGLRVSHQQLLQVWKKDLENGDVAVVLYNSHPLGTHIITLRFMEVGFANTTKVVIRDLFLHKDLGVFVDSFFARVEANGCRMFRLSLAD